MRSLDRTGLDWLLELLLPNVCSNLAKVLKNVEAFFTCITWQHELRRRLHVHYVVMTVLADRRSGNFGHTE